MARSVDGGAGVTRPVPWPSMRMDAISAGSGQRGKEKAVNFFDYAVILLLELSAFACWVESKSVYPIPPYLKSFIRGILTPVGSQHLIAHALNFRGWVSYCITVYFYSNRKIY